MQTKMTRQNRRAVALVLTLLAAAAVAPVQPADEAEGGATPMPLSGFEDEGTFLLFKNESQIGTIHYNLNARGDYERSFSLSLGGQTLETELTVRSDDDGRWTAMTIVAPTDTATVERKQGKAVIVSEAQGISMSVDLTDGHILYDNYGPALDGLLVREYDMEAKGEQTFPRFLVPQTMMDCTLEYERTESRRIAGAETEFLVFNFTIAGIPTSLWTDEAGKVYLMDVPVQYAAFVREGYEALLKKADDAQDVPLSRAEFDVRKESEMIAMRDGVRLATDLYFPDPGSAGADERRWPVILIRTPYKKDMQELDGEFWARRGYVTAIQDCRGRFGSEGTWEPFLHEADDGYDTIEWLGTQDWSTGKVGMIGASYVGWVQLWAASGKPPHLATIIPNVAPPDPFFNIPYEYGTFFILGSIWWAEILETEATGDLSGKALSKIGERRYEQILKKLPVIDLDREIFGRENPYWRNWIRHNTNDDYWEPANFMDDLAEVDIPVFLQSGWFDGDGIGSKLNYEALTRSGNAPVKLILGPWGHTAQSTTSLGEYEFGDEAGLDLQTLYVRWFDRWLKEMDNGVEHEPLVRLFAMFSNQWLTGDTYPLAETRFTPLHLASAKGANTSKGDGRLVLSADGNLPDLGREYDQYTYDPGDPTPWPVYYYKSEQEIEEEQQGTVDVADRRARVEAFHNSVTDVRRDILVYETEPLDEALTIVGPISAVLYASSTAVDTDWFISLLRVDAEGDLLPLTRGTIRARFRNSMSRPELLEKKKIYEYTLDLWQTGITFREGERIRIEVASALFPAFSRNLNTGGHNEMETKFRKAKQRIYHSEAWPSRILLPVVDLPQAGR